MRGVHDGAVGVGNADWPDPRTFIDDGGREVQKWAVLPESAMAVRSGGIIVGGGPMVTEERLKSESLITLDGWIVRSLVIIGSPRRQLPGELVRPREAVLEEGEAARRRRAEERPLERPEKMVSQPPNIRNAVASSR